MSIKFRYDYIVQMGTVVQWTQTQLNNVHTLNGLLPLSPSLSPLDERPRPMPTIQHKRKSHTFHKYQITFSCFFNNINITVQSAIVLLLHQSPNHPFIIFGDRCDGCLTVIRSDKSQYGSHSCRILLAQHNTQSREKGGLDCIGTL